MEKSKQIGAIIFGAAAILAVYKFYQMSKEERNDFISAIKRKTEELLEDSENTVEKVQQYVAEIKSKNPGEWFDKMYLLKKMFSEFYGQSRPTMAISR